MTKEILMHKFQPPTSNLQRSSNFQGPIGSRLEPLPTVDGLSACGCREAYGVRAACCRFRHAKDNLIPRTIRKGQQAARTPYASRHPHALNKYRTGRRLESGACLE